MGAPLPRHAPVVLWALPAALLVACAQAPGPEGSSLGTGTAPREPIPTEQVLQGIQIGEGGDELPCVSILTRETDADAIALFSDLPGWWPSLPYAYEGRAGTADLEVALDTVYARTWADIEGSSFDCTAEPRSWVAAMWLDIDGERPVEIPVFAAALSAPAIDFVGRVDAAELGTDASGTYDLRGTVLDGELTVELSTDLLYGEPLGGFGAGAR